MKAKLLLILITAGLLTSCQNKEKYTLEYKLDKDVHICYHGVNDVISIQNTMGREVQTATNMEMMLHYEITDVQEEDFSMQMWFDNIKTDIAMDIEGENIFKMSFNSNTDVEKATLDNLDPFYRAMTNVPYKMKVTKIEKVESVEGFERMIESLISVAEIENDTIDLDKVKTTMEEYFGNESIKTIFEQIGSYLPGKPVCINESWNISMKMKLSHTIYDLDIKYTLKSVEDNLAQIEIEGTLKAPEDVTYIVNGMETTSTLSGTQTGTLYIDMDTGWPIKSIIRQDLTGNVTMTGINIPTSMTSNITMNRVPFSSQ